MTKRSPARPATTLETKRAWISLQAIELYRQGKTSNEVGRIIGKSASTVCIYLKEHGVSRRDRSDRGGGGVVDGKKMCRDCEDWFILDDFYKFKDKEREEPRRSSYCKPCDKERAKASGRRSKKVRDRGDINKKKEVLHHQAQSVLLLDEAARIIAGRFPDLQIVYDIAAHLSLGKRLFGQ